MLLQFLPLSVCENMAVLPPKPARERARGWAVGYSATSVSSCTQYPHGEDGQGVSTASRGCENWALESGEKKGMSQSVGWGPSAGQHKLTSSTVPVWVHPCLRNKWDNRKVSHRKRCWPFSPSPKCCSCLSLQARADKEEIMSVLPMKVNIMDKAPVSHSRLLYRDRLHS